MVRQLGGVRLMDLFVRRKISWEAEPETVPAPQPVVEVVPEPIDKVQGVLGEIIYPIEPDVLKDKSGSLAIEAKTKNGNGHQKTMIRKLYDGERAIILQEFLKLNGQLTPDAKECSKLRLMLDQALAVWQVTGYTSVLHRYVAEGQLFVKDTNSYMEWMKVRPGQGLWTQYNAVKFQESRLLQAKGKLKPSATVQKLLNINVDDYMVNAGLWKTKTEGVVLKPQWSVLNKKATLTGG